MSVRYFLVCMDCKSGVLLGKVIPVEYFGSSCFGFSQLKETEEWHDLPQFLLAHRSHELRVLPGNAEKFAADIGFPHSFPGGNDNEGLAEREHLAEMTKQPPDPELDLSKLDQAVIDRLKNF